MSATPLTDSLASTGGREHASDSPSGMFANSCQARAAVGITGIQWLRREASLPGAQVERQMVWGGCAAMVIRGKVLMEPIVAQVLFCPKTLIKAYSDCP